MLLLQDSQETCMGNLQETWAPRMPAQVSWEVSGVRRLQDSRLPVQASKGRLQKAQHVLRQLLSAGNRSGQ